ncbi:MAG: hypothetical protein ACO1RA_16530 [Planctomycetaceae bacterium]
MRSLPLVRHVLASSAILAAISLCGGDAVIFAQEKPSGEAKEPEKKEGNKKPTEKKVEAKPNKPAEKPKPKDANRPKNTGAITPEREAAVMKFVERSHPALLELLRPLKESQPKEYERAVRELLRVTERLEAVEQRDKHLHTLELQAWTLQSRNQLITARLKVAREKHKAAQSTDDMPPSELQKIEELESELEGVLGQQIDVRIEILSYERAKAQERLEKLDKEIADMKANRNQVVAKQAQQLTGGKFRAKIAPKGKPGAGDNNKKTPTVPTSTPRENDVK